MTDVKAAIAQMSYAEIVRYMNDASAEAPIQVTQRLYEIAPFDHHVPDEHRKDAWERLDTVKWMFEHGLKDQPNIIAQYAATNRSMEEEAQRSGVLSRVADRRKRHIRH